MTHCAEPNMTARVAIGWRSLLISVALAFSIVGLACVKVDEEADGGSTLYVYDDTTHSVMAWSDVSALYESGAASTADRTITGSDLDFTLGWGGMALDRTSSSLYLVSTGGVVVRISRIDSQSGELSSTSDILSFSLDDTDTDAEGSGVYGQAAVSAAGNLLYVTESSSGTSKSQIWVIPTSVMADGATLTKSSASIIGNTSASGGVSDKACTGIATGSSQVFAYFNKGGSISPSGTDSYTGARLRMGTSSGFAATSNVIVGASDNATTRLGPYGCLAYDAGNDRLYVARHTTDSALSGDPLLMFQPATFAPGLESAPDATFSGPNDLRVIAHAGGSDWLVGAESADDVNGTNTLWIWKDLATGVDTHTYVSLPDDISIRGLAVDGSD